MKNAITIAALCLVLFAFAATANAKTDQLSFEMDTGWKIAHSLETKKMKMIEYVPKGDDIENWNELFTYQNFGKNYFNHHPEKMLDAIKALREKECPGVTQWTVIAQDQNSILYEWQAGPCLGNPEQHEIARIIYGKYNCFFLHYAAKVHELSPETRAKWLKLLQAATVHWE
jgi:hypothetical protein